MKKQAPDIFKIKSGTHFATLHVPGTTTLARWSGTKSRTSFLCCVPGDTKRVPYHHIYTDVCDDADEDDLLTLFAPEISPQAKKSSRWKKTSTRCPAGYKLTQAQYEYTRERY